MKEKFLITGASGFVGACLTRRLVKMGLKVHALVPPSGNLWRITDILPQINLHRVDIADEACVNQVIQEIQPDIIYHLATHGAYPTQEDAKRMVMTNVIGTLNLLQALEKIPYQLFVNTGSSSEYGFKSLPMKEENCLEPNSFYAIAKASQTMLCQYMARSRKKPIVTFRLFSVYGPYEEPSRLVPTIIRRCLKGEGLSMASPQTARDFIFVEDVIDAYLNIAKLILRQGDIFNIGTGKQVSLKEMTDTVLYLTKAQVEVQWNAMPDRIWDSSMWVGDVRKAREFLDWHPKTPLDQGLRQTMEWMKNDEFTRA